MAKHWFIKKFGWEVVKISDTQQAAAFELIEDVMDKYQKWDFDRRNRG